MTQPVRVFCNCATGDDAQHSSGEAPIAAQVGVADEFHADDGNLKKVLEDLGRLLDDAALLSSGVANLGDARSA